MQSVLTCLFLCSLAVLAWWLLRDADRSLEEVEEGIGDYEEAEAAEVCGQGTDASFRNREQ